MGKKSSLKKILRIAADLPVITEKKLVTTRVMGLEVIAAGTKELDGKPIDCNQVYKKTLQQPVAINHNRRMKKVYNKFGTGGVNAYIHLVKEFASQQTASQQTANADHS